MFLTSTYYITSHDSDMKDENVAIIRNLRNNDLKRASIILDLENKTIVKCRDYQKEDKLLNDIPDYDEVYNYFYTLYPTQLDTVVNYLKGNSK